MVSEPRRFTLCSFSLITLFILLLTGIRHDDYDYGEVNKLLDRPLKAFIKTACCYPDRITKQDYDSILVELLDSEKVHVNLMILEAKNQAVLLYALRELNR
jgi:sestrin 1/3